MTLPRAVVVDLDGTLALAVNRGPFDWQHVASDVVNAPIRDLVVMLREQGYAILIVSGRSDECREATEVWLAEHLGPVDLLLMRRAKDFRKDVVVKREMFEGSIVKDYDVVYAFDDRDQSVDLWRNELGVTTLQVANGTF